MGRKNLRQVYLYKPGRVVTSLVKLHPVGSYFDTEEKAGLAHLSEHLLYCGTKTRNNDKLQLDLHRLGINFNAYTDYDYVVQYFQYHNAVKNEAEALINEMFETATFDKEKFETEKKVVLQEAIVRQDNPLIYISDLINEKRNKGTGYGICAVGSEEGISKISMDDIKNWIKNAHKNTAVEIMIGGEMNKAKSVPKNSSIKITYPEIVETSIRVQEEINRKDMNGVDFIWQWDHKPLSIVTDKEWYTMAMLQSMLCSAYGSIWMEIRERQGLAYRIGGGSSYSYGLGLFEINGSTDKKNLKKLEDSLFKELKKIVDGEFKKDIMKFHLESLRNKYLMVSESDISFAMQLTEMYYYGKENYLKNYLFGITQVTKEDVQILAKEIFEKKPSWIRALKK